MTPAVSVIVPFYNAQNYIADCLLCLKNQTLKNIEMIFVDDASTDKGKAIVSESAAVDHRIRLIEMKENSGQGPARNAGLDYATGEYVYFLDIDDFISFDALESLYNVATCGGDGTDIVVFNSVSVSQECSYYRSLEDIPQNEVLGGAYQTRSLKAGKTYIGKEYTLSTLESSHGFFPLVWMNLYRRDFLEKTGLRFEPIVHEDNIYTIETSLAAHSVIWCNEVFHYHRIVSESIMHQNKQEKHVVGGLRIMEHSVELYEKHVEDRRSELCFHKWCLLCAGIAYNNLMHCDKSTRKKYKRKFISIMISSPRKFNPQLILKSLFL